MAETSRVKYGRKRCTANHEAVPEWVAMVEGSWVRVAGRTELDALESMKAMLLKRGYQVPKDLHVKRDDGWLDLVPLLD